MVEFRLGLLRPSSSSGALFKAATLNASLCIKLLTLSLTLDEERMKLSLIVFLAMLTLSAKSEGLPQDALLAQQSRGFAIVQSREGQCTLCHSIPQFKGVVGNLGPSLEGVGKRLSEEQLRARLIDSRKINPNTIMPAYYSTEGLNRVDPKLLGKTILSASELEDVLAYLKSL